MQRYQTRRFLYPIKVFTFVGKVKYMEEGFKTNDKYSKKVSGEKNRRNNHFQRC